MRIFYALLVFYGLSVSAAFAVEDCILDRDAIKPIMPREAGRIGSHTMSMDDETRHLTQSMTLKNGMKITYSVGGCTHYAFNYIFENIPTEITKAHKSYDLAVALLQAVPVTDPVETNLFIDILKFARENKTKIDKNGGFACGDAYCEFKTKDKRVELSYDFPL